MDMSEEELRHLVFEANHYRPFWLFMQTSAGSEFIPNYHDLTWAERARKFSQLGDWAVDAVTLRRDFLRFNESKN